MDATSFYRGARPMGLLKKKLDFGIITNPQALNWPETSSCDAVYLQRPFSEAHVQMCNLARYLNLPIWIDFDDNIWDIPIHNKAWQNYRAAGTRQNILSMLQMAAVVTTTTPFLKSKVTHKNVKVIPNCYDDYLLGEGSRLQRKKNIKPRKMIFWRGSDSHQKDLMQVTEAIIKLSRADQKWEWGIMGYDPFFLLQNMPPSRTHFINYTDIIRYFEEIQKRQAAIHIVPLFVDDFNKAKSNIAWIEATHAGSVVLAPDIEEWRKPGIVNYKNPVTHPTDFEEKLKHMMDNFDEYRGFNEISWAYIKENLLLSNVNEKRADILREIIKDL